MIYANFKSILLPEDNGKQNPNESYNNKYQKHVACIYGYKLVYADDKFSKPFKPHLGEGAAYDFFSTMIEENKYFSDMMKKQFNKEVVITQKDNEDLRTLLNVGYVIMLILMVVLT